ncbi:MAG: S1C family serine protease [Aristaeellaceae bacterium]
MKSRWKKNLLGYVAVAVVCMMIGSAVTLCVNPVASAEDNTQTVVVTSPFTQAIAQVRDSVVGISNYQLVRYSTNSNTWGGYFGYGYGGRGGNSTTTEPQVQEVLAATGSGVVVGEGIVLTNYHVVEDASSLKVTVMEEGNTEATEYEAVLVTYDENLDVAIVQAPELKLAPVALGDSDTLQVGDWAICIGNPLGQEFSGTVTTGIVSALDRSISSETYDKYGRRETITNTMIQTDAAINSGNSGGGMFSVTGELMGIPTLKYTGSAYSGTTVEGIGMCIPINAAKPLIEDVLSGKVTAAELPESTENAETVTSTLVGKPRLGVTITNMNTSSSALRNGDLPNGVYIREVEKDGPADKAGLQAGDIIVDVNDTVITSSSQLQEIIAASKEGDVLHLKVYRVPGLATLDVNEQIPDGEYIDVDVTLAIVDDVKQ